MIKDNDLANERRILGMEFIKRPDGNYIVKDSGYVVSEKEKLEMENKELVIKDISETCAKETTKQISKNKKRIKELENIEETKPTEE
jgi:hypothetical protein